MAVMFFLNSVPRITPFKPGFVFGIHCILESVYSLSENLEMLMSFYGIKKIYNKDNNLS